MFPRSCFHSCNVRKSPGNMLSVSSFGWLGSRAHMFWNLSDQPIWRKRRHVVCDCHQPLPGCWYTEHSLPPASHGLNRKERRATGAESQSVDLSLLSFIHSLLWLHVCNPTLGFVAPWPPLINRIITEYWKCISILFPFVEVWKLTFNPINTVCSFEFSVESRTSAWGSMRSVTLRKRCLPQAALTNHRRRRAGRRSRYCELLVVGSHDPFKEEIHSGKFTEKVSFETSSNSR